MESHPASLGVLAEAVADGSNVDWDQAEASAGTPDEREIIRQLRALATLREAARPEIETWGGLHIREEVGAGTFGTVYRAWDPRLDREVALKLLHSDHAASPLSSQVIAEGRLLGQIRHPNVVIVHGADAFDNRVGIWMEYIRGRTLKDIVTEHGPLSAQEALVLGLELCRALAAVHQRGFVHGDVKAQNVMREDGGRTVLMDFGAGDALRRSDAAPERLAGTPAYLAPEVLNGAAHSVASDLYSLGVLLFYAVSGHFPVSGASVDEIRERHAQGRRALLRDVRPDLPASFVRLVDKATAPDPAERPASAGAMELLLESALTSRAESSDGIAPTPAVTGSQPIPSSGPVASAGGRGWGRGRLAIAAAIVVPLIAAAGWIIPSRFRAPVAAPRNSVVVLPFKNLTDDRGNDYLSEGIATDIVASLAKLRELRVISSASVRPSRIQERSPLELGAELGVAAVLEGSVRQSGDRIRIVSQLLAVPTGEQLWSETFDRDVKDIFRIQSEVSRKIAIALRGELSQTDAARLGPVRQADFEAFNLYLKGRHYWSLRTEEGFRRSLEHFEQALQHDPNYAPAHAGLADVYTLMGVYGMMPRTESVARARAAAERAIELDPGLAEAHASLGYIQKNRFEWAAADASFRRALSLKPGYSSAHHWYGISLTQQGRFAEAITELKIAVSLDPLSIGPAAQLASTLLMARRYDEAIQQAEKVLQMDASFGRAHQTIAEAHAYSGRYDRALAALQQAVQLMPPGGDDQDLQADFGYIYAKSGRQADALRVATMLIERFKGEQQPVAGAISTIYAALGQTGEAFNWLDVARKRNDLEMGYLKIDPRWDPLRADPRFASYLASVGFVE